MKLREWKLKVEGYSKKEQREGEREYEAKLIRREIEKRNRVNKGSRK